MGTPVFDVRPTGQAIAGGGTSPLRLFSSEFMYFPAGGSDPEKGDGDWQTNANLQASTYELMTPRGVDYDTVLTGMRTQRTGSMPPFKMLGYARSTGYPGGVESPAFAPGDDSDHPIDLYNYDTEQPVFPYANKAFVTGGGAYIMKVWDPRWIERCKTYYTAMMSDMDYDGTLIDVMGDYPTGSANKHFDGTGAGTQPWNPVTDSNVWFSSNEWMDMTSNLGAHVRRAIGSNRFCGFNGISSGTDYWNGSRQLLGPMPGGMVEDFIRSATESPANWPSVANMKDCVDMLVDAGIWGWTLFCNVKFWPKLTLTDPQLGAAWSTAPAAHKLNRSRQWFALGTALYLLGTNGRHYLGVRHDNPNETYAPINTANLGTPAGVDASVLGRHRQFGESYYGSTDIWWKRIDIRTPSTYPRDPLWTGSTTLTNRHHVDTMLVAGKTNMWARQFSNGVVVVNGHTADQTYSLPAGTYLGLDGTTASGSITIPGTASMSADATKRNARVLTKL